MKMSYIKEGIGKESVGQVLRLLAVDPLVLLDSTAPGDSSLLTLLDPLLANLLHTFMYWL